MPSADAGARGLSARGLACARGGRELFSGLAFTLPPGTALQVRGSNGSGKSSLLRLLSGLLPPERGELRWEGLEFRAPESRYGEAVAFMGHASGLCGELTVRENLRFATDVAAPPAPAAELESVLAGLGIAGCAGQPVRRLSQGQRQRVALARVRLAARPLWLLDEPCAALDDEGRALFESALATHLAEGGMAVIATHHAIAGAGRALPAIDLDAFTHAERPGRDRRA